ncbi:hypothetical protein [Croceicoccus gelatinilyticus]|uniref:hypothetical protein n=1 Tax=Croceicoccus gelatinilyticus TaxID=2835536 RepID=UPI001BCB90C4|nr:hypothetical protein [Croceicoccus gelatinilyticus]MBS7669322.1 hypothetical protein [Croceicoccus gelatinilyticus]
MTDKSVAVVVAGAMAAVFFVVGRRAIVWRQSRALMKAKLAEIRGARVGADRA